MTYIEITAQNNYDAGYQFGEKLKKLGKEYLELAKPRGMSWETLIEKSRPYLEATKKVFPQYVEELRGLAEGSDCSFDKIWANLCEEEIVERPKNGCTSIYAKTKHGFILGHNEDNSGFDPETNLVILKRTIKDITVLELCYTLTIGGLSASINSFGLVQSINTLDHKDYQAGVPKNIIGRWLSEAKSFQSIKKELPKIKRGSGYNHNFYQNGKIMNIEMSAKDYTIFETDNDYVHTNHFTRKAEEFENHDALVLGVTTFKRLRDAAHLVKSIENVEDMKDALSSQSKKHPDMCICNESTIGSIIFDMSSKLAYFAVNRPTSETRWLELELDFLQKN